MTPERFLLACGVLLLAACTRQDPYIRSDVWRPSGVNAGNLAAMVANPADLVAGRGVTRHDTKATTAAIEHVWAGTPQPLSYGGGQGSGMGGAGGAGAGMTPAAAPGS